MAVDANGRPIANGGPVMPVKIKEETTNGHATNGHPVGPVSKRRTAPRRSWRGWLFSNAARLTIWYAILTILFRCPTDPSEISDTSPQLCKPYLSTRSVVQPYVQPYYDTYAGPYVDKARPYADQVNSKVLVPATAIAKRNYAKYAAPQLESARSYGQSQWEKAVVPQLRSAQTQATQLYSANFGPHVSKASEAVGPYYSAVRDTADNVHKNHVLPAYELSKPYLETGYSSSQNFISNTAIPFMRHGWASSLIFIDGTLWPALKGLYIDNVRPQLVMISERIAKYQESRKLKAVMDEVEHPSEPPSTSNVEEFVAATPSSTDSALDDMFAWDEPASTVASSISSAIPSSSDEPPPKKEPVWATNEQIDDDLAKWQQKFAAAADKGTEDLSERVGDIVSSLAKSDIDGLGRGLATALELTAATEIDNVKARIQSVVGSLSDDSSAEDTKQAEEDVLKAVRASGLAVKSRAVKVRDWAKKFELQVDERISAASASTLEVLDGIRDLGLQEIGMRWAWMEGVSYKHWAKYHDLKKTLDEWRQEVRDTAMDHEAAISAKATAQQILEESMAITEDAAKQLVKLKDVAKWKIRARDASDDFEPRVMPAAAASAASSLAAEFQATTQGSVESAASSANSLAQDAMSSASSVAFGEEDPVASMTDSVAAFSESVASSVSSLMYGSTGTFESAASEVGSSARDAAGAVSSAILGTSTGSVEDAISSASSFVDNNMESASSVILGTSTGSVQDAMSSASSFAEENAERASSIIFGSTGTAEAVIASASSLADAGASSAASLVSSLTASSPEPLSMASSSIESFASEASSAAESVHTKGSSFIPGALAQDVKGSIPILDDYFDDTSDSSLSKSLESIVSDAGDRYAEATRAAAEVLFGKKQGTAASLTSVAAEQYSSAYSAASSVLFPTQGTGESIASVASGKYADAVAAASRAIYATPTPAYDSVAQQANSLYSEAVSRASANYDAAKSILSSQISGTPKPIHMQMYSSIEAAYLGAQTAASGRLEAALSAASSQYSSMSNKIVPTQGPLESISSIAASRLQDALQLASEQYSAAKTAVGATSTPVSEQYLRAAQGQYYAAIGYAHEQYSRFLTSGSEAAYSASAAIAGPPSGSPQSVASVASQNWEAAVSEVSKKLYGTPKPFYEDLASQAGEYSAQATNAAAENYLAVQAYVSELVIGREPDFTESVMNRLSSAYYTGLAGIPAAASSYASEAYDSASSVASSVSSIASTYFTPPPEVNSALNSITEQLDAAVSIASVQVFGAEKGTIEQVTSAIAGSYSSASSAASVAAFGTEAGYAEQASKSINDAMGSAQSAISIAIYGTPTGTVEALTSAIGDTYASAASIAAENLDAAGSVVGDTYASASSMAAENLDAAGSVVGDITKSAASVVGSVGASVSSIIYGPEQGALESAQSRILEAVESARSAIAAMATDAGEAGASVVAAMSSNVEQAASAVSSSVSSVSKSVKDEL